MKVLGGQNEDFLLFKGFHRPSPLCALLNLGLSTKADLMTTCLFGVFLVSVCDYKPCHVPHK